MFSDIKILKTRIKDGHNYNSFSEQELDKMKKVRLTYLYSMRRFNLKMAIYLGVLSLILFLLLDPVMTLEIHFFASALIGASAVYLLDVIFLRNPERTYDRYILKNILREKEILEES